MSRTKRTAITGVAALLLAAGAGAASTTPAAAHDRSAAKASQGVEKFSTQLRPLNDSGTRGVASVAIKGEALHVKERVRGASDGLPHAQHIHFGEEARHECPTLARDDDNNDGLINTSEGQPAYGPIVASLTTRGDTSPGSALALARMPVANQKGFYNYNRNGIPANDNVRDAIRDGEAVIVVHGIDANNNGRYDNAGLGVSELAPVPQEATVPAACGVLSAR